MLIRRLIILLLIVGCLFAQKIPSQSIIEGMTPAEKHLLYQNMQQDPVENMVRSYLFPTLGHYKVNNWERGAKIYLGGLLISLGSGILLESALKQDEPSGFIYAMIGAAITHIWQIVDAGKETKKYNRRLYKSIYGKESPSITINLLPFYQGANITMSYAFN